MDEIQTTSSSSMRDSTARLPQIKNKIIEILTERQKIALNIHPLHSKNSNYLYSLINENPKYYLLLLGTSHFLVKIGRYLQLSLATITTALVYLNRFYEQFRFEETERKYVAASCILLAWKYREDTEGERNTRKLLEIPRILYRVIAKSAEIESRVAAPSSSKWILQDEGMALTKIKERIKLYEIGLLRSIEYNIGPFPTPFPVLYSCCKRFVLTFPNQQNVFEVQCNSFSKLKKMTTLLIVDCYKSPLCLEYSVYELVIACTWKAAILLNLIGITNSSTPNHESNDYTNKTKFEELEKRMKEFVDAFDTTNAIDCNRIRSALTDIRQMYEVMHLLNIHK